MTVYSVTAQAAPWTLCSVLGTLTARKTLRFQSMSKDQLGWQTAWHTGLMRRRWGSWGFLTWRKGGLGEVLFLSSTIWKEVAVSGSQSPRHLVTGGGSGQKLQRGRFRVHTVKFSQKGWLGIRTGCPEKWWNQHPWKHS